MPNLLIAGGGGGAAAWLTTLSVTSAWPYFVCSALIVAVASALIGVLPFYRRLLAREAASSRFHAIDGLRGYLALGVFFHHAVIRFFYYSTGRWEAPPSRFYTNLGQTGVIFFFMITAFLFWGKGLTSRPYLSVQPFLWTRMTRLVPMYLFSVIAVFLLALGLTNWQLKTSPGTLFRSFEIWASFGFMEQVDINALPGSKYINWVYWTLQYEWMFHLALPLALIFARGRAFVLLVAVSALFVRHAWLPVEWSFLFGALAALLHERLQAMRVVWDGWQVSLFASLCITTAISCFDADYRLGPIALLFIAFVCIANGNTLFGLLRLRASRFLGTISYSIYLLHCIVLYVAFQAIDASAPVSEMSAGRFWAVVAICGILTVLLSALTYRGIEHPFMRIPMPPWLGSAKPVSGPPPALALNAAPTAR